jgi:ubiquinone/menaquinone biosynthesis C-methylase UbiE
MDEETYKQYYETVATQKNIWNTEKNTPMYFQEMIRYEAVLKQLPQSATHVVDLGCGDGYLSYLMARAGHVVTSVDLSANRLKKFEEVARKYHIQQVQADIKNTGLPAGYFDAVVCSEVIEHIEGYEDVLREAYRILKPGGTFIVTVPYNEELKIIICPHCHKPFYRDGHVNSFNKKNLAESLQQAGFVVELQTTFRSKLSVHIQYHFKLKYGFFLKGMDWFFSKLRPNFTFYLLVKSRKKIE